MSNAIPNNEYFLCILYRFQQDESFEFFKTLNYIRSHKEFSMHAKQGRA